ncbi:hypothetical protein EJK51_0121 [Moraxella catarrhalis]|nr:hypothetical protein MCR_0113 [Moraxella catarrhalis BBH18]AZQ87598.1 hypothetical protein EJK52_0123 [Moraxella catarrhalis]EKF84377.1 hypothetical protein MCRH_0154 [Moraxella catarrhalis RH4]AZQ90277.1 hypothetical protein EJK50_0119 [Moraxella catarrhalis]AZQ91636.1 hypothetical protein EJK51_0121 [Moraxella catarrhalis]
MLQFVSKMAIYPCLDAWQIYLKTPNHIDLGLKSCRHKPN